jgi:hypothetical protein
MKIWLDDERPSPGDDWVVAKTAEEAVDLLGDNEGRVEIVSLDHDLGDGNGTGYDIASYLEWRHHMSFPTPGTIRIHSANPVGRGRMALALAKIPGFRP